MRNHSSGSEPSPCPLLAQASGPKISGNLIKGWNGSAWLLQDTLIGLQDCWWQLSANSTIVAYQTANPTSFLCCVVGSASLLSASAIFWRLAIAGRVQSWGIWAAPSQTWSTVMQVQKLIRPTSLLAEASAISRGSLVWLDKRPLIRISRRSPSQPPWQSRGGRAAHFASPWHHGASRVAVSPPNTALVNTHCIAARPGRRLDCDATSHPLRRACNINDVDAPPPLCPTILILQLFSSHSSSPLPLPLLLPPRRPLPASIPTPPTRRRHGAPHHRICGGCSRRPLWRRPRRPRHRRQGPERWRAAGHPPLPRRGHCVSGNAGGPWRVGGGAEER